MPKLALGELFPLEVAPAEEAASSVFEGHVLTVKDVLDWNGPRESVVSLIADKINCAPGLRDSGAVLEIPSRGLTVKQLVFKQNETLYVTQSDVLIKKCIGEGSVLRALRERADGKDLEVRIVEITAKSQRKYYSFAVSSKGSLFGVVNSKMQTFASKAEGPHNSRPECDDGVGMGRKMCRNTKPDGSLVCTRLDGHAGFHHGSCGKLGCSGSWK